MINSTNPVVRNALGIKGGTVAANAKLPETGEYRAAKQAWDKASSAFDDLGRLSHSMGLANKRRGDKLLDLAYEIDQLMRQFT